MDILTKLAEIANSLDAKGAYEEAAMADDIIRLYAEPQRPMSHLEQSRKTNELLQRKRKELEQAKQQRRQQQAPAQQQPQAPAQQKQQPQQQAPAQQQPQAPAQQQGIPMGEMERARMPDGTIPLAKVPLKPQQPQQQPKKQKPRMKGKTRQKWLQNYKNIANVMGLETSNPKAVFRAVQKKYPGTYQKGMTAEQLYKAVSEKALTGQTSQQPQEQVLSSQPRA